MATMEYDGNIDFSQETPVAPVQLQPCPTCSRSFNPKALEKHAPICLKAMNGTRRRGKFDSTTQRVLPGTKATGSPSAKQDAPKKKEKPAWKVKHEQFVRNIRAARKAQAVIDAGGSLADLPPPPPDENPDYVKCPHCERRFNEDAAKRHMKFCEEQSKRNALKKKKNSNDPKALAASRRTQYKPPLPKQRTPAKSASTTTRTPTTRASARPLPVEEEGTAVSSPSHPHTRQRAKPPTAASDSPGRFRRSQRTTSHTRLSAADSSSPSPSPSPFSTSSYPFDQQRPAPDTFLGEKVGRGDRHGSASSVGSRSSTGSYRIGSASRPKYCCSCGESLATGPKIFCTECGERFPDKAKFCGQCGTRR
eukprot:m.52482 g.52482  ORF g.52482 m.52482 type:complete len:364 (+) comp11303_c0_seq5:115-1206(+)